MSFEHFVYATVIVPLIVSGGYWKFDRYCIAGDSILECEYRSIIYSGSSRSNLADILPAIAMPAITVPVLSCP